MVIVPGNPPTVQVISDAGDLIYKATLNTFDRRKVSRRWLSFNTILFNLGSGFAKSSKEADELVEKKLIELWGNPHVNDFPDWAILS